jgi:hypothetical protein
MVVDEVGVANHNVVRIKIILSLECFILMYVSPCLVICTYNPFMISTNPTTIEIEFIYNNNNDNNNLP